MIKQLPNGQNDMLVNSQELTYEIRRAEQYVLVYVIISIRSERDIEPEWATLITCLSTRCTLICRLSFISDTFMLKSVG